MMRSLKHVLRAPLVLASFWLQVRRARQHERSAYVLAWFRIHWRWLWTGNGVPITVRLLGFTVEAWDAGILRVLFKEIFIDEHYAFEPGTTSPTIIDCGANIGMSVLYFKRCWPDARIIAIEANPNAFALLQRNVERNGLRNVTLINAAVAEKEGTMDFFINQELGTLLGSVRPDREGQQRLEVPAMRLSLVFDRFENRVDAVKVDIEGAEWMMLRDLEDSGCIAVPRHYLVEYHHRVGGDKSTLAGFLAPFEKSGFEYNLTALPQPGTTFQDVRLHFFRLPAGM